MPWSKALRLLTWVAFLAAFGGWLTMWFTQEAIWTPANQRCAALATIELKGHIYRTCSYLVNRYHTGQTVFSVSCLFALSCMLISRFVTASNDERASTKSSQ